MTALGERIRRLPVRARLALAGTLLLPIALAVVFGLVFLRFEGGLNHAIDGDLRARADTLGTLVGRDGNAALRSVAATELLRPLGAFAQIVGKDGRVRASTAPVAGVRLLTPAQAARAAASGLRSDRGRIAGVAKRSRLVAVPRGGRGEALVVGRSLKDREGANESFGRALLIGIPLALILSAVACYLAAAAALRPVETMRRRATEITGGEPYAQLPVPAADDEIGRLGHTLNNMIARLQTSLTRQHELTQNASHELRTPLTVLTGEIELALQTDLPAASRDAMTTALEQAQRVSRLAQNLLTLAHLEESNLPLAVETADLDEVVRLAAARAGQQPLAHGRAIVVESETTIAPVDVTRIEQAVGNLVDNALAHGEGQVTVALHDGPAALTITVGDEGEGFPQELRDTAFERFVRSSDARHHGAGLGLAIIRAIAEAHGGTVSIDAEEPATVVITLPRDYFSAAGQTIR